MDEKTLAAELVKGLKTGADLNQFSRRLTKLTVETALSAKLNDHLGQVKCSQNGHQHPQRLLISDDGEIELNTPRDREIVDTCNEMDKADVSPTRTSKSHRCRLKSR